ncbi:MAG TPA: SMP-30/gluconolactonase/LRE family protein [Capillimicrobium sp.]|nr:SMP-30/gluconolactonase/LRE family protein [Capillimicrobium sp.]
MTLASDVVVDGLHFAECLRWRDGALWFSDMYGDSVQRLDPETGERRIVARVFHPGGIGWLPDGRLLAIASEDRRIFAAGESGNTPYADLSEVAPGWTNDMLVDGHGRAYVGNFGYDLFSEEPRATRIILVDADGSVSTQPGDLVFPNGMVRRSDGSLVVAETFAHRLATFAVAGDGSLTPTGTIPLDEDLTPDGMCVDAEDGIWFASVFTREVVRVDADGSAERIPVSQNAYACMLGGEDRRTLFVATAPDHEPANRRARTEGRIEALRVDVPGAGRDGVGG